MAITASKPAINIRERLADLSNPPKYNQQQFWFTGDASTTDFTLPSGWQPLHVFNAGLLQKEGTSDEYTVSSAGVIYTIAFSVAPASGNDIGVIAE
jgi:hypothetical protein